MQLERALRSAAGIDEYIVTHQRVEGLRRYVGSHRSQTEVARSSLAAQIFADRRQGRGQSFLQLNNEAPLATQIRRATARALEASGPPWRLRPPSAPARVSVNDAGWQHDPHEIVDEALQTLISTLPVGMRALDVDLSFSREELGVIDSNGFDNQYRSTLMSISATLSAASGRPIPLRLHARQRSDLRWNENIEKAARQSQDYARAHGLEAGPCDVIIRADAYEPERLGDFGLWTAIVTQSSAELFRGGLARYSLGQEITRAPPRGDALSIHSDGTIDYGLRSAPHGDDGQPVRRFPIVDKGIAAGHSVDHREAALSGTTANGGVRNVIVDGGAKGLEEIMTPGERPLLIIEAISSIASEARGRIALQISRARWRRQNPATGMQELPVLGGVISGDLYHWLEDAYYSRERYASGWCSGPQAIRFNGLQVRQ